MSETWNDVAKRFLEQRDFCCEPEPSWVEGKKPDFFCTGPFDLWVEVKSMREQEENEHLFRIHDYLRKHVDKVVSPGRAFVYVAPEATLRDAKTILTLANWALSQPMAIGPSTVWIIIPSSPVYGQFVHFSIKSTDGSAWIVSSKARDGLYGYPFYLHPEPWRQTVEVISGIGTATRAYLDSFAHQDRFRLALQILPGQETFQIVCTTHSGSAKRLTTKERLREDIRKAGAQIRNGLRYRKAPSAIFVFQDGVLVPDEGVIYSAMFGDLTVRFSRDPESSSDLGFGDGAAWHAGKNRSISALTYFRNYAAGGVPTTIHNPYAVRPLRRGVFGGRDVMPMDRGQFIDFDLIEYIP